MSSELLNPHSALPGFYQCLCLLSTISLSFPYCQFSTELFKTSNTLKISFSRSSAKKILMLTFNRLTPLMDFLPGMNPFSFGFKPFVMLWISPFGFEYFSYPITLKIAY